MISDEVSQIFFKTIFTLTHVRCIQKLGKMGG